MMIAEDNFLRTRLGIVVIGVLLCLGIGLRLANVSNVNITARSPDERVYTHLANSFLKHGNSGVRSLVEEYQRDPGVRVSYPPVTRIGYLWLLAATMRITGKTDESAGAILSCAASIGSLFVLALVGIRFLPPWATIVALLFFAVSPAELALARRTWGDALLGLLAFVLVWATAEIVRDSRRRVWYLLLIAAGTLGLVVKESWPLVYGLSGVWLLWVLLIQRRQLKNGLLLVAGGGAGAALSFAWLAFSAGGPEVVVGVLNNWVHAVGASAYTLEYQSGPGYLILQGFWIMSPVPTALCLTGLGVALLSRPRLNILRVPPEVADSQVISWLAFFTSCYLAIAILVPYWLNLRYMSVIFGPFYLLAGLGFWYVAWAGRERVEGAFRRPLAALAIAAIVICAVTEYRRFERVFVRGAVPDLSIKMILDSRTAGEAAVATGGSPETSNLAEALAAAEADAKRAHAPQTYLNLSLRYYQAGRYQESIAAGREALKLKPDYPEAFNNIGAAYNQLARWDEAIQAEQQAIRLNPEFQLARNNLAWSLSQKKRSDDELAASEAQAKRAPTPEKYVNLSLQYYRNGRFQDALAASREALRLRPDYAEAHNNVAAAYQAMGRWEEAIEAAQQALKLKPEFQLARNNLQFSLEQKRLEDSARSGKR